MKKLGLAVIAAALVGLFAGNASAAPADKVAVGADTPLVVRCTTKLGLGTIDCKVAAGDDGPGTFGHPILPAFLYKSSTSGDLIFDLNLECILFTETRVSKSKSSAEATLLVWVQLDDDNQFDEGSEVGDEPIIVRVSPATTPAGDGKVSFCNRLQELEHEGGEFDEDVIRLLLRTKQAHGFTWVIQNPAVFVADNRPLWALQKNEYFITVRAEIILAKSNDAVAGAGFLKRLLIVDSVHLAVGETF